MRILALHTLEALAFRPRIWPVAGLGRRRRSSLFARRLKKSRVKCPLRGILNQAFNSTKTSGSKYLTTVTGLTFQNSYNYRPDFKTYKPAGHARWTLQGLNVFSCHKADQLSDRAPDHGGAVLREGLGTCHALRLHALALGVHCCWIGLRRLHRLGTYEAEPARIARSARLI